jgi:hypothetical protein
MLKPLKGVMNYSPLQLATKSYSGSNLASNLARARHVGNFVSAFQILEFAGLYFYPL